MAMLLTDKLKSVAVDAKAIRESLSLHDPRNPGFDPGTAEHGYRQIGRGGDGWNRRIAEAASLISDVHTGRRPDWHLREAMTTSDFPLLFGDLLYRQLLGNYQPWPVTYPSYFRILDVKDFRTMNMLTIDGGTGLFTNAQGDFGTLKQYEPYPETKFEEGRYTLSVGKYGKRYGISMEMVVNDDLNAFSQRPILMASGARRSEEYLATTMLVDANGPHASFFTVANKNIISGNPAPSVAALQEGFITLGAMVDADGQPILIDASILVCGPADEVKWQNVLNATQLRIADTGTSSTATQWLYTQNWMKSRVTLVVNPYFPYVASTLWNSGSGTQPWLLIASPSNPANRPAFMFGFLRGRQQPQLFMKDPDTISLSGGRSDPMEGSFDNDAIDYKIRHIFGAAQGDPKMAVSSNGSGR
jgi:hypothetical protein